MAMKEIVLKPLEQPIYTLEAKVITPDNFAGKTLEEISELKVYYGNQTAALKDFFEVSGETSENPEELRIVIDGDVSKTKRIGQEMKAGEILIKGSAGMYVGALMKGGKITVEGNVDSFSGMMMTGGEIHIKGSAGDYLGCTYRGDRLGMRGGVIVVEGDAGIETGQYLNGGKIIVKGSTGAFTGVHMKKGLIVVEGKAGARVGAQMTGGAIVVKGGIESLLPSFDFDEKVENPSVDDESFEGIFDKYSGDYAEKGAKGSLYVKA